MAETPVAAHIGKATFEYPNVEDTWNVTATGQFNGSATLVMTQVKNKVTIVSSFDGQDPFTLVAKFTKKSPDTLSAKSPKFTFEESPKPIAFRMTLNFSHGIISPITFTGSADVKKVGSVATLAGTRLVD